MSILTAAANGTTRASGPLSALHSWFWDVERDLVWSGPGVPGVQDDADHPWLGKRDVADAVPMLQWLTHLTEGQPDQVLEFVERIRESEQGAELRTDVHAGETGRWYALRAVVAESVDGRVTRVYGLAFDLTRLRAGEEQLRLREDLLEQIRTASPLVEVLDQICLALHNALPAQNVGVLIHDRESGRLWPASAPTADDATRAALVGIPVAEGSSAAGTAAARGEDVYVPDITQHTYNDHHRDTLLEQGVRATWAHPLLSTNGRVVGVIGIYRPVTGEPTERERDLIHRYGRLAAFAIERASVRQELQQSASVDYYTGLPNRATFLELVNGVLADEDEVSVLAVDLDGFDRTISGRHHLEMQAIVREAAARLVGLVGDEGIVASLGTAEFAAAVVMPEADAEALGDRILRLFDQPVVVHKGAFYLSASVGVSHASRLDDTKPDAYALARDAATALSAARAEGRGRRRTYDTALHERVVGRLERETDLRRGIEEGEFFLAYQPLINVKTGLFDRVEALVRWQHPTRGLVPPDEFITLAEECGLIVPLGDLVFRLAVEQARIWRPTFPDMRIAVNVSSVQLANHAFPDEVTAMLEAAGVPASMFSVEVTESGLIESLEVSRACLERLLALGMGIAVDDFGTGHSSLARLDEIPATGLKVDKSFVQRLTTDPVAPKVVRAIVDVADAHGLVVVAEGVEDEATFQMVKELGCRWVQGYHFSRPVDPETAAEFLQRGL